MVVNQDVRAIIQARMGSTRLPGKVLRDILGKPMIWHIVQRLKDVKAIAGVVVATSISQADDELADFCVSANIPVFRGSELDVLDRYFQTATEIGGDNFIRITGDCPLIDPDVITNLIDNYFTKQLDYCSVATGAGLAGAQEVNRFPDGMDAEILSLKVLTEAWQKATKSSDREHVTPFIWQQPNRYNMDHVYPEEYDYSKLRWTVDNQEDFDLVLWIYKKLYPENNHFRMKNILELMKRYPGKQNINKHLIGKEGYETFWD
jgi:spore coat polysaccharide biosynthesis protein SpsF